MPLEKARHFGMICNCEAHIKARVEDRKKHVPCWRNGRRLGEAWDYISKDAKKMLERSRTLTVAECEGDEDVRRIVSYLLKRSHMLEMQRFGYLNSPPWTAVHVTTIEGAKAWKRDIQRHPMSKHDPLTQRIERLYGEHIQVRADGGPIHPRLQEFKDMMDTANLDESCGEGWHRGSQYEKKRAYSSTTASLKRAVRRRGVFYA